MDDVKFALGIFPDAQKESPASLIVSRTVGDRPGKRLQNFIHLRIASTMDLRFPLSLLAAH